MRTTVETGRWTPLHPLPPSFPGGKKPLISPFGCAHASCLPSSASWYLQSTEKTKKRRGYETNPLGSGCLSARGDRITNKRHGPHEEHRFSAYDCNEQSFFVWFLPECRLNSVTLYAVPPPNRCWGLILWLCVCSMNSCFINFPQQCVGTWQPSQSTASWCFSTASLLCWTGGEHNP